MCAGPKDESGVWCLRAGQATRQPRVLRAAVGRCRGSRSPQQETNSVVGQGSEASRGR